jgi:hypothetical protein
MSAYAELKARHCQDLFARLPEMTAHIGWSREQLRGERERRLRELIDTAVQRSPWHRARLSGHDPSTVTEDTLAGVPIMTKDDLLEHFDEIVTDPRLRRDLVEAHLHGCARTPTCSIVTTPSPAAAPAADAGCSSTAGTRGRTARQESCAGG